MSTTSHKLRTILMAVLIVAMMMLGFISAASADDDSEGEDNDNHGCVQANVGISLLNPKDCNGKSNDGGPFDIFDVH